MASFIEEKYKISEKMADLVMEYASWYLAREYLEAYENAKDDALGEFVPAAFDDKIYKRVLRQMKIKTGRSSRAFRILRILVVAALIAIGGLV